MGTVTTPLFIYIYTADTNWMLLWLSCHSVRKLIANHTQTSVNTGLQDVVSPSIALTRLAHCYVLRIFSFFIFKENVHIDKTSTNDVN